MIKLSKIIFIFLMFISIYCIYINTEKEELSYLLVGDLPQAYELNKYNTIYSNENNTINDILNILKYNKEINNKSLHQLLNNSDILLLSIGRNDIYNKIITNKQDIYKFVEELLIKEEEIFKIINRYNLKKVYVLSYYNNSYNNSDIFTYINYYLEKLTKKYNFNYINIDFIKENPSKYLKNRTNLLNNNAYKEINKIIVENY